ncbi:hypothetical protein MTO96_042087 [Rhipicephalus appendiculatus]
MEDKPDAAFAGVPGLQQPPSFDFNDPNPTTSQLREKTANGKKSKPPLQTLREQRRHKSPMKAELESPGLVAELRLREDL